MGEIITKVHDIFSARSDGYGQTGRVYHSIDICRSGPTRQPPCRLPLVKVIEVIEILSDTKGREVIEKSVFGFAHRARYEGEERDSILCGLPDG
jgi:hypothetical protein